MIEAGDVQQQEGAESPAAEEQPLNERERMWWVVAGVIVLGTFALFGFLLLVATKLPGSSY